MPSRPALPSLDSPRHSCSSSTPGGARRAVPAKRGGNGWLLASRIGSNARYTTVQVRDGGSPTSAVHGLSPRRVCAAKRQSAHLALYRFGPRPVGGFYFFCDCSFFMLISPDSPHLTHTPDFIDRRSSSRDSTVLKVLCFRFFVTERALGSRERRTVCVVCTVTVHGVCVTACFSP
jgi:hypothetical protein